MSLVERIAEAIDETAGHVLRGQANVWRVDPRAIAQAVLEALGLVTCQTCGGSGEKDDGCPTPSGGSCGYKVRCPDCGGLGVVPSEAMIERAAEAWAMANRPHARPLSIPWERLNPGLKRQYRSRMTAALLAAFGGDDATD